MNNNHKSMTHEQQDFYMGNPKREKPWRGLALKYIFQSLQIMMFRLGHPTGLEDANSLP